VAEPIAKDDDVWFDVQDRFLQVLHGSMLGSLHQIYTWYPSGQNVVNLSSTC